VFNGKMWERGGAVHCARTKTSSTIDDEERGGHEKSTAGCEMPQMHGSDKRKASAGAL